MNVVTRESATAAASGPTPDSGAKPKSTRLRESYRGTLGRVAHDIRSATGVAWTALGEIERAGQTDAIDSFLRIGQRSLRRLLLLADRLTLAGAIEDGSLELARCETSIAELLRGVVDDVSFTLGRRSITISFEPPSADLVVSADGRWLAAALTELIGNAIRFARTRAIITAAASEGFIDITIEDDGPGLPEAARASLVDGVPTPPTAHGLGLSLPLAHQVVAAHEGALVASAPEGGRGTRIVVRLPVAKRSSET